MIILQYVIPIVLAFWFIIVGIQLLRKMNKAFTYEVDIDKWVTFYRYLKYLAEKEDQEGGDNQ